MKLFLAKKIYQKYKQNGIVGLFQVFLKKIYNSNPNVSLKYHACFIHIPKCGGSSIEELLFNENNKRVFSGKNKKDLESKGSDHSSILSFKKYYSFYIFTFVRNPYTRIISIYNYYMQNGNGGFADKNKISDKENTTLDNFLDLYTCNDISHLNTQFFYLKDSKHINFIGKFENYNLDLKKILAILKVKNKKIKHIRKSKKFNYLITPKFVEKVNQIYEIDFKKYKYKMITLRESVLYDEFLKTYDFK